MQGSGLPFDAARFVRRLGDRFADAAATCRDLAGLRAMLDDATGQLGFRFFALLEHSSLRWPGAYVRLDSYPASWAEEMLEAGLAADDPVHLACRRTSAGFRWSELPALIPLERPQRKILSRSRRHGLGSGFTVPAHAPGEPMASCSFAVGAGDDLPMARLYCAETIGGHALRALRRLSAAGRPRPHLSRREIECLKLVALGKTDWEIAAILGIGLETARQYVKRARGAYDVVSRTQLAILGLRDDWIDFDDAIPPGGGISQG